MNLSDGAHMEVPMSEDQFPGEAVLTLGEKVVMAARLAAIEHIAQELAEHPPEHPTESVEQGDPQLQMTLPLNPGLIHRMRGNLARILHGFSGREVA